MAQLQKQSLTLTHDGLQALNGWLQYIFHQPAGSNYYHLMLVGVLGELYKKKVYPKTAFAQPQVKIKLDEVQTLALSISFMVYDFTDAPMDVQAELFSVYQSLPALRYDQESLFLPPQIATVDECE